MLYDWKEGSSNGELGPLVVEYKSPTSGNHASPLCDLGLGARVSFCAFNFLREKWGKPSTDNTRRDTGLAVGHVQERFLTHCQVDKKQAITGSGAFAADSLETEEERSCSSVIL